MVERLRFIFSLQKISIAIVVLAIVSRTIQLLFFYNLGEDLAYQVMATQNLAYGHGITLAKALPTDLSVTIYEPLIKWPPGYSLLLYPFYVLFQHNYAAACLTVEILAAIALIIYARRILRLLGVPIYLINLYTLVSAFFIHTFYVFISTDGITISLFVIAIYHTLFLLKASRNYLLHALLITLCLTLCATLKYLFVPLVFVLPAFLLVKAVVDKNVQLKRTAAVAIVILFVVIATMLAYQKTVSGSVAYTRTPGVGFYPEHILSAYPFIPASFVKPDTFPAVLQMPLSIANGFLQLIHLAFFVMVLIYFITSFRRKEYKNMTLVQSFEWVSFLISLTIFLSLLILSLRIATDKISSGYWTFLQDARYYGLAIVLIQLAFFIFLHNCRYQKNVLKPVVLLLFVLLATEVFRGAGFVANRIVNIKREEYSWRHDLRFQKYAAELVEKEKKKYTVDHAVLTGSEYLNNRVTLQTTIPRMYDDELINDISTLSTSKPVLLIVIFQDVARQKFAPFIAAHQIREVGRFESFTFYSVHIQPNQSTRAK